MPADAYSARLRLRYQATGGNTNTWGALLNTAVGQLIEDAICGKADVTVSVGDVTLSQNNGATDQSRMAMVNLIGSPTAAFNCIVPTITKLYLVINNTGQTATITTSGGSGVAVPTGNNQYVACDGVNVVAVQSQAIGTVANAAALGGVPAGLFTRLDVFDDRSAGFATTFSNLIDGPTITLDCLQSNCFLGILGGNRTLSITDPSDGQQIEIWFQQDGTGSRTITWPGNVKFEAGSSNTLSVTPLAVDRFQLTYSAHFAQWIARSGIGFATSGTTTLTITTNEQDLNIFTRAGSPGGVVTVNVTTAVGTVIRSSSAATPAIDFAGFASGSTINWTNLGYVQGMGGEGGLGAEIGSGGSTTTDSSGGKIGTPGGSAVKGPGSGRNFNVTNASGFIWGGGGGGGGGGAALAGSPAVANGGGGGGGAGGGRAGQGGASQTTVAAIGNPGIVGGSGVNGTFGTGGAGNHSGGTTAGASGGNGGDWGSGGATGGTASGSGVVTSPGTGGAAGKAIDANGGTVSFVSGSGGPNVKGAVL